MDAIQRLAELVSPPEADELAPPSSSAWELVTAFLGTTLPDPYVALVDRFGAGSFDIGNERYLVYLDLWGPREVFARAPGSLQVNVAFRDADDRSSSFGFVDPQPRPPLTRVDLRHMADWPFWPEPNGAIPVGGADGDELHLLRHPDGRWRLGWAVHEWGIVEADTTVAEWIVGWLTGDHSLTGEGEEDRPGDVEVTFAARPATLHLAELRPSTEPFDARAEVLNRMAHVRRDFVAGLDGPPLAPLSLVRYASAGWQRLDVSVTVGSGPTPSGASAWYDDAVDGSGRHRVGVLVPQRQPEAATAIDLVAAALGCDVLEVQII